MGRNIGRWDRAMEVHATGGRGCWMVGFGNTSTVASGLDTAGPIVRDYTNTMRLIYWDRFNRVTVAHKDYPLNLVNILDGLRGSGSVILELVFCMLNVNSLKAVCMKNAVL
jgi:hypothetical protein